MKILELFSGYGTASFALKQLGIDYECIGYSDIDKYANQCFHINHGGRQLGDCTKINPNTLEDFDLLTGGFPCQSFSNAGKGLGELDIRGTLFNEIIRIAEVKKPRYMLLENVRGLASKKHIGTFNKIMSELERIGYYVSWVILNTKDYGIPQNRERVWFACFKNKEDYDRFVFPEKEELKIFLKDILEQAPPEWYKDLEELKTHSIEEIYQGDETYGEHIKELENQIKLREVDEKYYLNEEQSDRLLSSGWKSKLIAIANTIRSGGRGSLNNKHTWDLVQIDNIINEDVSTFRSRNFIKGDVCPTLQSAMSHGNTIPLIIPIKNATKKGYLEAKEGDGISLEHPDSKTRRGRVQKQMSATLQCNDSKGVVTEDLRIRKLTPIECFRLQGFVNDEVDLEGISNTQSYKLAGNGQSVNVVKKIFENMLSSSFLKPEVKNEP